MRHRLEDADLGYVRLAYAILRQAISDAAASLCTWRTEAVPPSAADVRDARAFLAAPAAHWLAARLGLSLEEILHRLDALTDAAPQPDEWLGLRQAAQLLGCQPEHLRRLIHRGRVVARRGRGGRWLVARHVVAAGPHPPNSPRPRHADVLSRAPCEPAAVPRQGRS